MKTKADEILELSETQAKPMPKLADLSDSAIVQYKPGHEFAGLVGRVIGKNIDANTVNLKVGNSTRVDVSADDLLMLEG